MRNTLVCQARVGVCFVVLAMTMPTHGDVMFWTSHDRIWRAHFDGSGLATAVTGLTGARGIAVDVEGGKLYWTEGGRTIHRANLDGSGAEVFYDEPFSNPWSLAIDSDARKIYWSSWSNFLPTIGRANLDGTSVEVVADDPDDNQPWGIALDVVQQDVYWSMHGSGVAKAKFDGTAVDVILTHDQIPGATRDIALDLSGRKVYVADNNTVMRANLDGTNLETFVTQSFGFPTGIAVDDVEQKVYWTHPSNSGSVARIQRANLDGTDIETVVTVTNSGFSSIALVHAIPGDTDDDFDIDDVDLSRLLSNFGFTGLNRGTHDGDFDLDRVVGDVDLSVLLSNFGTSGGTSRAANQLSGATIPEPTFFGMFGVAIVMMLMRRSQHPRHMRAGTSPEHQDCARGKTDPIKMLVVA